MTTSSDIRIRVNAEQKQQLRGLAKGQGFSTISEYVRSKIFNDLSLHEKLNKILEVIQK